ncbi:ly6/PLAUR domain-containing protein 3 isoform X1 [Cricetulus griseus]|uniref:ly6/PLAUR domain-containing protein 3 isoform X1 n=1 Tax=Cricetulus griseus TaxID=10029 RepID=UPI0004545B3B|nr:ly6/PLAUR domain-containing protein 3 isoform X1 [Cricetulus griseus]
MDAAKRGDAQTVVWTTGWLLLLLWLLGAQALECYSCVQKADDGCSPHKMKTVKCGPGPFFQDKSGNLGSTLFPSKHLVETQSVVSRWPFCVSLIANVTVSLPVRGCVQDESCTRDGVTGPGFTLSGSCCQGPRCNSDLRNKTYFSPRIPPLVLLPPPTTLAPSTRTQTSSTSTSKGAATTTNSTTRPTSAPASHTSPHAAEHETVLQEEEWCVPGGGAAGHQDRSNTGKTPPKGGAQIPANQGSVVLGSGLPALLLTCRSTHCIGLQFREAANCCKYTAGVAQLFDAATASPDGD